MPLSKDKNKERMRAIRATQVQPNGLMKPQKPERQYLQPDSDSVLSKLETVQPKALDLKIPGLIMDGNKIISVQPSATETPVRPPIYDPKRHVAGDLVRKWVNGAWLELVVPELDGEGNVLEAF